MARLRIDFRRLTAPHEGRVADLQGDGHVDGIGREAAGDNHGSQPAFVNLGLVKQFLADEADEGRHPGHRERGERRRQRHPWQARAEAVQNRDVARARRFVHRAGHHEERRLVQRVDHEEDHGGLEGGGGSHAEQQHERAEGAHGRVGEQAFQIGLGQGQQRAAEHGHGPCGHEHRRPRGESAEDGKQFGQRKTPAFTMVAECKYALTGVGAAMAPGSQK